MEWVYQLHLEFLQKEYKRPDTPAEEELQQAFEKALEKGSLKIMVQEPWMGTIRFKTLAKHPMSSPEAKKLYENPMAYLCERFGGGKFKVNFYQGMHFVATKNFKPQGEPLWPDLPECPDD